MDYLGPDTPEAQTIDPLAPRPCSSVYSDNFPLEDLVHKVDESMRVLEVNTVERLTKENVMLQEVLAMYRRSWHELRDFLGEVMELTLLTQGSREECISRKNAAEREWLASWGIGIGSEATTWI